MRIRLPNNWTPRAYQRDAWDYLETGGKHAELVWHRRSGKDEVALHWAATAAFKRVANYWHMLPEYSQARKAIWEAVNPHTGKRRIDEAFPILLRKTTREQEMQIVFLNGSTWQVVGSDSYNRLVGSTPAGVVYSEWALTNPTARAYLRPILAENDGWQIFITTPRGRNHALMSFQAAQTTPGTFAQKLTAHDTNVFTPERLETERRAYTESFGEDEGIALFEQEYFCSWSAQLLGAYYGSEMRRAEESGRITQVSYDDALPVMSAWDLGYRDDTAIFFYQVLRNEIRIIDFYSVSGADIHDIADVVMSKPYKYKKHYLPHDARAKTLQTGRSIIEQLAAYLGVGTLAIVPEIGVQNGIQAARQALSKCWFDAEKCKAGIEALRQYQREWDDDKKVFRQSPRHDWTSHPADAFRMLAISWSEAPLKPAQADDKYLIVGPQNTVTLDEMWSVHEKQASRRARL